MRLKLLFFLCLLVNSYITTAQNYPGGVTGAEVWYIVDWNHIGNGEFLNFSQTDIEINKCGGYYKKYLFNFNPSIFTEKLCLKYNAPLENTTGRNAFFVGEPKTNRHSMSHLGTLWRSDFTNVAETDSIIRNFFDVNTKNVYAREIYADYTSDKNASVNFYHTNHYNIDKKFKSYGQEGETTFYIGKPTLIDPDQTYDDNYFLGGFPEFISYPRELSANERQRVESYLALKYGLTLNKKTSYLSSKNIVFWDDSNNNLFPNRVFGFGKDKISSLNQLQSESTHLKKHLVSAIGKIMSTNIAKQKYVNIPDNHFLVFGDNGKKPAITRDNDFGVKFWEKVWLAQRTGRKTENFPIHYKLFLTNELRDILSNDPDLTLWFLHDKYIGNDEVSDFNNHHIAYYPAASVNLVKKYAYFKDIYFDDDRSVYDQFTFGVGPRMIVQAQVQGCKKDKLKVVLDITGGKPPYHIVVESPQGIFEDTTDNATYSFSADADVPYHITVTDVSGIVAVVDITPQPWDFNLDLGPDQYLSASQPEIVLDAGIGISDPDATYQWYLDDVLLPDTTSILTVTEAGVYDVVVTSADLSCEVTDSITISYKKLEVSLSHINGCDQLHNSLTITIGEGIPNFTTTLEGDNGIINYAHSGTTTITDIPYGSYIVTVTDAVGGTYTDIVEFILPPTGLGMDIYAQLEDLVDLYGGFYNYNSPGFDAPLFFVSFTVSTFSIDASIGVDTPNINYQWYINGQPIGGNTSVLTLTIGSICYPSVGTLPNFTVIASNDSANCFATQSFVIRSRCPENDPLQQSHTNEEDLNTTSLRTTVYPNPSEPSTTFTYKAVATEQFNATVEVFTVTGARLYHVEIQGDSTYTLPFSLHSAGMYLIKTTSSLGIKTNKVIIK